MARKEDTMVARPAQVLTPYSLALIRRQALLKAHMERLDLLNKAIKAKLDAMCEAELAIDGAKMALVDVRGNAIRVSATDRAMPAYKNIALDLIGGDEDALKEKTQERNAAGRPKFLTPFTVYAAKLLGSNRMTAALTSDVEGRRIAWEEQAPRRQIIVD